MSISETLKQKIDEFDLDRRFNDLAIQTERGVNIALDRASEWADQHRSEIAGWIDKAEATVDDKTDGKYAEHGRSAEYQCGSADPSPKISHAGS